MSLESRLIDWTVKHNRINPNRNYIGLSGIHECPLVIYRNLLAETPRYRNQGEMLRFYLGYAAEDDVVCRLQGLGDYQPGVTISLYDGLVQGHTDGSFDGSLVEIKSVALDEWLPGFDTPNKNHSATQPAGTRLPRKTYWQVQAYLRYTRFAKAKAIYLSRESGLLKVFDVDRNNALGSEIHQKITGLVHAVRGRIPPGCECGRCGDE